MTALQAQFRHVLSHYPTGVSAIAGLDGSDAPCAMIVGSFTSVSLDPCLVGFLVGHASTSWPRLAETGRFCVNVLASEQHALCLKIASRDPDRLADIPFADDGAGRLRLGGAAASIDCDLHSTVEMGDHLFVLAHVVSLHADADRDPLLFWKKGFCGTRAA